MLETKPIVRGPREEFRGQKCITRREKCIFIGIELLMFVCALAAMPRHTPSPGRQLGSYLHDTKLSWSLDHYNARRGRAELEARLALDLVNLISAQVRVQVPPSRRALLRVQVRGLEGQLQSAPGRQSRKQRGRPRLRRLGRRSRPEGARRDGDGRPRGPRVLDATRVDHAPSKHPAVDIPLRAVVLVPRSGLPTLVKNPLVIRCLAASKTLARAQPGDTKFNLS